MGLSKASGHVDSQPIRFTRQTKSALVNMIRALHKARPVAVIALWSAFSDPDISAIRGIYKWGVTCVSNEAL